ncbi:hypothetical protein [Sphingomonas sp.]|uniref:hypothetical protein n=1 Tax=Sphingomonas sp. TaxID=28214 RepID=UPI002ED78FAF
MYRRFLPAALLLAPTLAHAEWHEASSKHFVVYADEDPGKLKAYTERLERFDLTLRFITGTPDKPLSPQLRVHVFFVENIDAIHKLYGRSGVGGFYIPRSSGPVAFVPKNSGNGKLDGQTILQHEYGHSFMYSTWPSAVFPKWFSEGFAEFVGSAFYRPNGELIMGKAPDYRAYGLDRVGAMPAERLLSLTPKDEGLDSQTLYGRGFLLTHYSFLGGNTKPLVEYIGTLNAGKGIDEANKAWGNLATLDAKLNSYGKRPTLQTIAVTPDKVPVGEVKVRKLTPGEAATMKARIYSTRGVDEKRAAEVVGWARTTSAAYPNDQGAQDELAEAEFDAKNYAAAEAAADRALAADPSSIHALRYKGMAQMEIAQAEKNKDPARWRTIRSWFIKANKLDPNYPEPLILYYDSFEAAEQPATKAAQDGLIGAYVLAPYDDGLRIKAGKVLLQQGNIKAARVAIEKIAYGPHSGKENPALKVVQALDASGPEAALKVIAEQEAEQKKKADEAKAKKKAA